MLSADKIPFKIFAKRELLKLGVTPGSHINPSYSFLAVLFSEVSDSCLLKNYMLTNKAE